MHLCLSMNNLTMKLRKLLNTNIGNDTNHVVGRYTVFTRFTELILNLH